MSRAIRLAAVAAFASLLAACGGASHNAIPATNSPATSSVLVQPLSHSVVGQDGKTIQVMWSRDFQRAQDDLFRTVMRHGGGGGGSTNLTLHGGPVSTSPVVHLVLWGSAWGGASGGGPGDPDGAVTYLTGFYKAIGGTGWHNTETQYYGSNGVHIANTLNFAGVTYDSSNPPSSPTQTQMAAEAAKIAGTNGGPNISYVIALPSGVHPNGFQTQWCAWHSSTSANGTIISYTNLPYQPDAGSSCGANSVKSVNDGFSIVGGHEQAETETDPQPNSGWLDGSGSEIGDKCAWVNLSANYVGGYATQPLWDNLITGCSQSGP